MEHGGGDKVQIENTARELRALGADVEIKTDEDFIPRNYDIIHLFQLDWTPETYLYAQKAHEAEKPIILSPIHHSIKEVKRFDDEYVFDFRRLSKILFSNQFHRDTFKNVYRSLTDPKKIKPTRISKNAERSFGNVRKGFGADGPGDKRSGRNIRSEN